MRLILFIILLSFTCKSQKDLLYHNLAGSAISIGTGWFVYKTTDRIGLSLVSGLSAGIIAGIAKEEIWDRKWRRGQPSLDDKLSTCWGAFVGTPILRVCININREKRYTEYIEHNFKSDSTTIRQ